MDRDREERKDTGVKSQLASLLTIIERYLNLVMKSVMRMESRGQPQK